MGELMVHPNGKDKEMTEENIIPIGSLVEVIEGRTHPAGDRVRGGQKFYVEDYAPFNEDPEFYSEVYMGSDPEGFHVCTDADNVKLLLTPEQLRQRKYPTATEILKDLDLLGGWGEFDFNESEVTEDDTIELYGETPDGLRFGVQLKVTAIFPVDF